MQPIIFDDGTYNLGLLEKGSIRPKTVFSSLVLKSTKFPSET